MSKARTAITALALSAAGLVGLIQHEGYKSAAYIPVPGDVPTIGHGTTRYEDGSAVKLGDSVTPERAQVLLRNDASKFERAVKRCAPVPMYPHEYDAFVSLAYNIGEDAFCKSSLARKLRAGDYAGACREILKWDKFRGQPLRGLTLRRQAEYQQCTGGKP
jgi:lysozyme